MKSILFVIILATSAISFAKSYQVTGPVVEITDSTITVDKKGEKFEIARPAGMGGDIQKGAKVTVQYSMTATEIESEAKSEKKEKKSKK